MLRDLLGSKDARTGPAWREASDTTSKGAQSESAPRETRPRPVPREATT